MTLGKWQLDIAKCPLARLKARWKGLKPAGKAEKPRGRAAIAICRWKFLMEIPHGNAQLAVQQSGSRDAWG
jgi:hypothetical protein